MKKIKFIALALSLCLVFGFVGCDNKTPDDGGGTKPPVEETLTLKKPQNVRVSESGLVTWDAVEHATDYIVYVNAATDFVTEPYYQIPNAEQDAVIVIVACAEGYKDSEESDEVSYKGKARTTIAIGGRTEMHFGESKQYTAYINGELTTNITWEVIEGGEFASINRMGKLTAKEDKIDSNEIVTVKATLNSNPSVTCTKKVLVNGKPQLTQAMLDKVAAQEKMWFFGSVEIDAYNFTITNELTDSYSLTIDTKLDGTNWYAEYTDGNTGMSAALYFKNNQSVASQVSVSFMNDEEYTPMLDDNGNEVTWTEAGLYNNFKGLNASDFTFNKESWLWEYTGTDNTLKNRMVAAANPYDFVPTNFALLIHDGEIMGIYSVSEDDYKLVSGKRAVSKLFSYFHSGDTVDVPTIGKFTHDSKYDEQYGKFQSALDKMHERESYTLNYVQDSYSVLGGGETVTGFKETITENDCYFRPFDCLRSPSGNYSPFNENMRAYSGDDYGFHKFSEDRYNSFYTEYTEGVAGEQEAKLVATRAYTGDFSKAKPSFAFSPEIFTAFYEDKKSGEITFYADESMTPVASTFYYGVGTDIELYGLFATKGWSTGTDFTPYVTVSAEGEIVDSGFYFYLGYIYGVVQIRYEDLDGASLPGGVTVDFAEREAPNSYSQLEIINVETEDEHVNVLEYMKTMFDDEDIESRMPFFGDILGDSFATGFVTRRMDVGPNGTNVSKNAILLWYDVPLDKDYTITSSMRKVAERLHELGFTEQRGVFRKGNISIELEDHSLDFYIYIWKGNTN